MYDAVNKELISTLILICNFINVYSYHTNFLLSRDLANAR